MREYCANFPPPNTSHSRFKDFYTGSINEPIPKKESLEITRIYLIDLLIRAREILFIIVIDVEAADF